MPLVWRLYGDGLKALGGRRGHTGSGDGRQLPPQRGFDDGSGSCLGRRRKRGSCQAFCRSRGGFICTVHCLSDVQGIQLDFHLIHGEATDCTAFENMTALAEARPSHLVADKACDTNVIRTHLTAAGIRPASPPTSTRTAAIRWNKRIYRERNRIKRGSSISRSTAPLPRATINWLVSFSTRLISPPAQMVACRSRVNRT